MKVIGFGVGFLILLLSVSWVVQGNEFFLYKVFAPRMEQVRREVFEQSKAYNQGMQQEIENMIFQYQQADEGHRQALAAIILHRVADYDLDKMPSDVRTFILSLRRERMVER